MFIITFSNVIKKCLSYKTELIQWTDRVPTRGQYEYSFHSTHSKVSVKVFIFRIFLSVYLNCLKKIGEIVQCWPFNFVSRSDDTKNHSWLWSEQCPQNVMTEYHYNQTVVCASLKITNKNFLTKNYIFTDWGQKRIILSSSYRFSKKLILKIFFWELIKNIVSDNFKTWRIYCNYNVFTTFCKRFKFFALKDFLGKIFIDFIKWK